MECGNVDRSDASVVKDRDLVTIASNTASSNGSDRLSSLPLSIIHYIFSFLETVDIVRASAVARKWSDSSISFHLRNPESGCVISPFGNLISLTLEVADLEFVTRGVGYLLIFCPFLEALSLRLEWRDEDGLWPEFIYQMPDIAIPGVTNCLKTIKIDHFMGYDDEHKCIRHDGQLVRFLLKDGQVLQKLGITFACKYSDSTEARHMRSRMVEEFPRASPHVEIKFYYYPQYLLPEKGDFDISEIEITPIY